MRRENWAALEDTLEKVCGCVYTCVSVCLCTCVCVHVMCLCTCVFVSEQIVVFVWISVTSLHFFFEIRHFSDRFLQNVSHLWRSSTAPARPQVRRDPSVRRAVTHLTWPAWVPTAVHTHTDQHYKQHSLFCCLLMWFTHYFWLHILFFAVPNCSAFYRLCCLHEGLLHFNLNIHSHSWVKWAGEVSGDRSGM